MAMSKSQRVDELAKQIVQHRDLYYNKQPSVSDSVFDALCDELKKIDPEHSALTAVGAPVDHSAWEKITHPFAMGSLDKARNIDELTKWMLNTFTPNNSVFIVEKLDGISVLLTYEDGKLISAGTRGSGWEGENITRNIVKMGGVKKELPVAFTGSIRGEIIIKKEKLKTLFPDATNTRNTAGGIAKRLSGEDCEHLDVLFYQAVGDIELTSEFLQLKFLETELKLNVPNYRAFVGKTVNELIDNVVATYGEYQTGKRSSLDWDVDGLVVRINDLDAQKEMGEHHNRPLGAIALKFDADNAITTLLDVAWEVGNSGRITPVAILEPIFLSGAEVKRASIHNVKRLKELGLYRGCNVLVSRRNDVIPYVEEKVE
jgi:DNA ligase (NAD+)